MEDIEATNLKEPEVIEISVEELEVKEATNKLINIAKDRINVDAIVSESSIEEIKALEYEVEIKIKEGEPVFVQPVKNEDFKRLKRTGIKTINEVIGMTGFCSQCKSNVSMSKAYLVLWSNNRYILGNCENCETEIMKREK